MRNPPKKQPGQGEGVLHTVNGAALDVRHTALFLGTSEKTVRGMIARQLIPYRRLNSRIILLRSELEHFLMDLPGCTLDEAQAHREARHG